MNEKNIFLRRTITLQCWVIYPWFVKNWLQVFIAGTFGHWLMKVQINMYIQQVTEICLSKSCNFVMVCLNIVIVFEITKMWLFRLQVCLLIFSGIGDSTSHIYRKDGNSHGSVTLYYLVHQLSGLELSCQNYGFRLYLWYFWELIDVTWLRE